MILLRSVRKTWDVYNLVVNVMLCDIPYSKISSLIPINSVLTGHASSPLKRIKIKPSTVNQIWAQNNPYIFAFNICQSTTKRNDFFLL